jgi:hypothetical protein
MATAQFPDRPPKQNIYTPFPFNLIKITGLSKLRIELKYGDKYVS